jgi:hypothetical protein
VRLAIPGPSRYSSALRDDNGPETSRVTARLVLALWALAIYAVYWMGYLEGNP